MRPTVVGTTEHRSSRGAEGTARRSPGNRTSAALAARSTVPTPARGIASPGQMRKDSAHVYRCHSHRVPTVTIPGGPDLGPARHLSCRECGATVPLGPFYACGECFGPLEVAYEFGAVTRASIEAGPHNIWRYQDLLPVPSTVRDTPNLEPGCTPLVPRGQPGPRAGHAGAVGQGRQRQPDPLVQGPGRRPSRWRRPASSASPRWPARRPATSPTRSRRPPPGPGSARWCSSRPTSSSRRSSRPRCTAATLVAVEGTYDDVNRLASELAGDHEDWAFVNVNVRPYYAEGSKTLGYEVAEQLGWRLPEQVVVPVASGSQLTKVDKAFRELASLGLVDATPYKIFGAQATGCSPVGGRVQGRPRRRPPGPAGHHRQVAGDRQPGRRAVRARHRAAHRRAVEDVTDDEVVEGIRLLARTEGIFAETAGGVTVATLQKLLDGGPARPGRRDRRVQHRGRAEDPGRRRAARRTGSHHPGLRRGVHGHRPGLTPAGPGGPTGWMSRTDVIDLLTAPARATTLRLGRASRAPRTCSRSPNPPRVGSSTTRVRVVRARRPSTAGEERCLRAQ